MIYIIIIGFIIVTCYRLIKYKSFSKPLRTYEDYIQLYSRERTIPFGSKKKAIKILKEACHLSDISELQRKNLLLELGLTYGKIGDYVKAVSYLNQVFYNLNESFKYSPNLKKVLRIYLLAGEFQKAQFLYEDLKKRSEYDSKFKKLLRLEKDIYN